MSTYFPVVFETEPSGAISAWVPGLPIYAAADTRRQAALAIRQMVEHYLELEPRAVASAEIGAVRVEQLKRSRRATIVSVAALVGRARSRAKTSAARRNGRLGGRPRVEHQGEQLDALREANASLQQSHDVLGKTLTRLDAVGTTGGKATVATTVTRPRVKPAKTRKRPSLR